MNTEKNAELREQVEGALLKWAANVIEASEFDVATAKAVHVIVVDGQKLELCARKLEGSKVEREFTHEETVEGIRAMLGKGNDE